MANSTKKAATVQSAASKSSTGFMKPMNIKKPLIPIVGDQPLPRTEVVKRVWAYIKKNKLQDATNRRQINADDNLRKVFGNKDSVTMFEMTKLIGNHLG